MIYIIAAAFGISIIILWNKLDRVQDELDSLRDEVDELKSKTEESDDDDNGEWRDALIKP